MTSRLRSAIAALAVLTLGAACSASPTPHPETKPSDDDGPAPTFEITMFDVGTGLAVLVHGADFTVLYDGGSNDDRRTGADNRLVAYLALELAGGARIDHLFVSHPHRDHISLLPDVFASYDVREVWLSGASSDSGASEVLRAAIDAEPSIVVREAGASSPRGFAAGERIRLGSQATATVLSTRPDASDPNDASIVVRFDLGGVRALFMGDATGGVRRAPPAEPTSSSVEAELIDRASKELDSDVLVVGHHGSMTSTRARFLDAVSPTVALVSSGPMPYAKVVLPDPEIIALLESRGARVLRTDEHDEDCRTSPAKVGPDADGAPGGCSAVTLRLHGHEIAVEPGPLAD
ncbi:MAG: MBL fold metallo-hydrolase [Polyangiaceae bacterium]